MNVLVKSEIGKLDSCCFESTERVYMSENKRVNFRLKPFYKAYTKSDKV